MFNNLNNLFEKKKNYFNKNQNKTSLIKSSFYLFLKNKFENKLKNFSFILDYDPKENSLTITTENKVIANELTIQLVSLHSFFKDNEISLDKILIR